MHSAYRALLDRRGRTTVSVSSVEHVSHIYLLGLRALEIATERVKEACHGSDIGAAAIEAHFGLHAVYDLHEAYFRPKGVLAIEAQDEIYAQTGGHAAGALVLARGARTHRRVTFASAGGYGDEPYGMGPFGDGWIWQNYSREESKLQQRSEWYQKRVRGRYLWTPLEEAWWWYTSNPC